MTDLKKIFTAAPKSTFELLAQAGLGYYVPSYQRPYSWKKANTVDLIEDVVHGISMLNTTAGAAITFLGTIILIHDVKYTTVLPQVKGDLPTRVMLVIDGQQRITTLLLLNAALHGEISTRIYQLSRKGADKNFGLVWIRQRAQETAANLAMTLYQDMNYGDLDLRYYPRVIRAYEDTWSRSPRDASYKSPIASFLQQYGAYARPENEGKKFQLVLAEGGNYEALETNWKTIRRKLQDIAKAENSDMPTPIDIGNTAQETIFQEELPPEVLALIATPDGSKEKMAGTELLRLVLFARYLLEHVAVTEVDASDEQYAFDIFESLNTTGEPLTAYDTFKPAVIKGEGLASYNTSPSFPLMRVIEDYLSEYDNASDKHRATTQLLIPFASAETGRKLSKKLSDQRLYLKVEFEKLETSSAKRDFVQHLSYGAEFLHRVWPEDSKQSASIPELEKILDSQRQLALFSLDVLRSAKHRVTIAPLIRFFSRIQLAQASERGRAIDDFAGALRSMTAFFALWRGSRAGTANIDQQYRLLMAKGFDGTGPFARRAEGTDPAVVPPLSRLRQALRASLRDPDHGGISTKDAWVKHATEHATYDAGEVAKLLLFAATNNSVVDEAGGGLTMAAKNGTLEIMTSERWRELTVEHVAPQTKTVGWDPALYEDESFHGLGNLTLLPQGENSSLGNRSWEEKKILYRILSSPTADQLDLQLIEAKKAGFEIATSTEKILAAARFHPQLDAIARVRDAWTKGLVEARAKRLAELAWDQLVPWLGFGPNDPV